jgi:hypothetical protein
MKAEEWRKKKTVRVVAVANIKRYYKKIIQIFLLTLMIFILSFIA